MIFHTFRIKYLDVYLLFRSEGPRRYVYVGHVHLMNIET